GTLRQRNAQINQVNAQLEWAKKSVEVALGKEQAFLYENRILFADRELNENTPHRAEQLLDECPPERRNWEWNYLKRQCHTEVMTIQAHQSLIRALSVSPDGRLIATGASFDPRIRLWNAETGREERSVTTKLSNVETLAFSPDGRRIAT